MNRRDLNSGEDMSVSDLEEMPRARATAPARPARFTLLAQRDAADESQEADESFGSEDLADEEHAQSATPNTSPRPLRKEPLADESPELNQSFDAAPHDQNLGTPQRSAVTPPPPEELSSSQLDVPDDEPQTPYMPASMSEEDRLRQQLFDMQRLNEAFSSYHLAVGAVRDKQKVRSLPPTPRALTLNMDSFWIEHHFKSRTFPTAPRSIRIHPRSNGTQRPTPPRSQLGRCPSRKFLSLPPSIPPFLLLLSLLSLLYPAYATSTYKGRSPHPSRKEARRAGTSRAGRSAAKRKGGTGEERAREEGGC